jgi:hypothetical protein
MEAAQLHCSAATAHAVSVGEISDTEPSAPCPTQSRRPLVCGPTR